MVRDALFQSTPAPIGAGDDADAGAGCLAACFNPHPLRSERVTRPDPRPATPFESFNPHPLRSERVTSHCNRISHALHGFNPHPLRSERVTMNEKATLRKHLV